MHNPDITVTIKFNYSNNSFEVLNEEEEDEEGGGSSHQLHDVSQHEGEGGEEYRAWYTVYSIS